MGNRAVIRFTEKSTKGVEVYLHWNGGPESVCAFLRVLIERKWTRDDYLPARFCSVVTEFFDADGECTGHSLGVYPVNSMGDPGDNGIYAVSIIPDGFKVKHSQHKAGYTIKLDGVKGLTKDLLDKYAGIVSQLRVVRAKRQPIKQGESNVVSSNI